MQQRDLLEGLLKNVTQARDEASKTRARKPKIVLKIAPDLSSSEIEDVADAILLTGGIDGVIVSNTTIQRPASLVNRQYPSHTIPLLLPSCTRTLTTKPSFLQLQRSRPAASPVPR